MDTPVQPQPQKYMKNKLVQSRISGCIIKLSSNIDRTTQSTDSTTKLSGYNIIIHTANTFNVDVIIVLGNERLYSDLKSDTRITRSSIVKLNKSGGVVVRNDKQRNQQRNIQLKQYFYGINNELAPHTQVLHWREIEIYRVGGGFIAPSSALPIGGKRLIDPNKLTRIYPSSELLHSIMGVSHTSNVDELVSSNVAGYVYCSSVDMNKKTITLLTPAPGQLPSKLLLYGTVKWLDTT
jgi:polyribonucleotide 5'-hydroxyl-kinase